MLVFREILRTYYMNDLVILELGFNRISFFLNRCCVDETNRCDFLTGFFRRVFFLKYDRRRESPN